MPLNLLQDWCRGEHLSTQRSMLILGIPEDCSEDEFEETLYQALRHLGRYRIIGRMFRREENAQAFLLELAREFDYALVPREIQGKGGSWEVIVKPPNSDDEFLNRLNHFLEKERRTVSDMNRVLGTYSNYSPTKTAISADFWAWAQTLSAVMQPLLEQTLYRELRVFSGNTVSTPGLLAFDSWLEHTTEMLQMWQVPEVEKRRRLLECLQGPALQVVNVLRANNAAITVKECLEALKQEGQRPAPKRRCAQGCISRAAGEFQRASKESLVQFSRQAPAKAGPKPCRIEREAWQSCRGAIVHLPPLPSRWKEVTEEALLPGSPNTDASSPPLS